MSGELFQVFVKAVRRFQEMSDDFFDAMDMPQRMKHYLHSGNSLKDLPTWLSRFDFVIDEKSGRIQMVEINADTPCAEIEAYYANGVAAKYFQKDNPNSFEMNGLRSFMMDVYLRCCGNMSSSDLSAHPILFSCFDDYIEDYGTTLFLMNAMKEAVPPDVRDHILFESFYNLAIMPDGSLALPDGRTVSFLYRMHPMEILIEETADQDGSSLGELMMDGYKAGRFSMPSWRKAAFSMAGKRKLSGNTFRKVISRGISGWEICRKIRSGFENPSGAARERESKSSMAGDR